MPPKTRVPPCAAMPFMIAPMPCSRMPKCSTRPASGSAFHILVARSSGRNDGTPSMVVLLEPARSAEPPHSSGRRRGDRVDHRAGGHRGWPCPSGRPGTSGASSSQPSGRVRGLQPLEEGGVGGRLARPGVVRSRPTRPARPCRARRPRRVCSRTPGGTSKVWSGSKPSTFLVAATSSVAEGGAVGLAGVLGVRGRPRDDRAQHDEAGLVGDRLGLADRVVQRRDVLLVGRAAVGPVDGWTCQP